MNKIYLYNLEKLSLNKLDFLIKEIEKEFTENEKIINKIGEQSLLLHENLVIYEDIVKKYLLCRNLEGLDLIVYHKAVKKVKYFEDFIERKRNEFNIISSSQKELFEMLEAIDKEKQKRKKEEIK